jgi:TetR/AcrR family transcriptional repressor of nem operon
MGRPKTYDRRTALERAMGLFRAKGYEGTHLAELVEVTGLNRFSLYKEFGGKEGLYGAALRQYVEGLEELVALLDREPLGLANVRAFHRAQVAMDFEHGCFALNTVRERHVVPASAWATVEEFTAGMRGRLRANVRAAAEAGELPADRDPTALATALAVFDMGLLSYRSLGVEPAEVLRLVEEIERLLE